MASQQWIAHISDDLHYTFNYTEKEGTKNQSSFTTENPQWQRKLLI